MASLLANSIVAAADLIQPLYVFIASPGDVAEERKIVREIVAELNGPLRQKGWEIALLGWEDRGPTAGRAQADINEDVRRCDIFVGVLWKRWGTPTGEHSSGFAEEWDIARERHERTGRPDLWLYFKQIDDDVAANDELEAIRRLRKEVEDGELAFYKTFENTSGFEHLLRTRILAEVLDRSGLTRTDLGGPVLDWAAAYHQEPVALLPDGSNRAARRRRNYSPLWPTMRRSEALRPLPRVFAFGPVTSGSMPAIVLPRLD
jgi:hypothetical protein